MSRITIQDSTTKANTYLTVAPSIVGGVVDGTIVHGQALAYDATQTRFDTSVEVYKDLTGEFTQRSAGGGALPFTLNQFDIAGRIWEWSTTDSAGQVSQAYFTYHWPHDHKPNTDTFFHLHIGTNVSITTTTSFQVFASFAKRGNIVPVMKQLANITYTFTGAADLRRHIVVEIPMSTAVATGTTLANSELETDGILNIYVLYTRGLAPDTMANASRTFLFFADVHYLSDMGGGTLNKQAPFRS